MGMFFLFIDIDNFFFFSLLTVLPRIGTTGSGVLTPASMKSLLKNSVEFLISHLPNEQKNIIRISSGLDPNKRSLPTYKPSSSSPSTTLFGIAPFFVECGGKMVKRVGGVGGEGDGEVTDLPFSFSAPTTSRNVSRLLRGLQLPKPLLLEGSPGVGKSIFFFFTFFLFPFFFPSLRPFSCLFSLSFS